MVSRNIKIAPSQYDRYIEPFLGGAAVFFSLPQRRFLIADSNQELINCYIAIRDNWQEVECLLHQHQQRHSYDYYYEVRSKRSRCQFANAARLIYLNRTCWNGLYRVNKRGVFNVPKGTKTKVLLDSDDFNRVSQLLRNGILQCQDFAKSLSAAGQGDFVFIDPPYTVNHNLNGFLKYNESVFTWEDQVRLKTAIVSAVERGALITMTNANHDSIHELYGGLGSIEVIERSSVIAANSHQRGKTTEIILRIGWSR